MCCFLSTLAMVRIMCLFREDTTLLSLIYLRIFVLLGYKIKAVGSSTQILGCRISSNIVILFLSYFASWFNIADSSKACTTTFFLLPW